MICDAQGATLIWLDTAIDGASSCCSSDILHRIAAQLLQPSMRISRAAAHKLISSGGGGSLNHCPGQLLKSLPVELLYDDAGLELFEQITQLREYYLTAAETDILARHSADILSSCGASDGTLLVELGAGSMRKTRLLLEAVLAGGHRGVTFCALDLCQASLQAALQALQGVVKGRIQLVGLVGTYEQGLEFINSKQQTLFGLNHSSSVSSSQLNVDTAGDDLASSASECCDSLASSEDDSSAGDDIGGANDVCIAIEGLAGDSDAASSDAGWNGSSSSKILMWLGSSIGNYSREEGGKILRRIRERAMQPGDKLLVGMDRRNPAPKVALAYDDPQGVTRAFILNGLRHAQHLLQQQLSLQPAAAPAAAEELGELCCDNEPGSDRVALEPDHFEYFSVVNEELGRHEAYYKAIQDTTILLPAAIAAAVSPGAATAAVPAGGDDLSSAGVPAGAAVPVAVAVRAGELIHVEYSHKYSKQEVLQLAEGAGLQWVRSWPDSKNQYDLHMFSLVEGST